MLCVSSCATVSHPSLQQVPGSPTGNAYRLLLPAGTQIALPDDAAAAQVRAVAVNELAPASGLATARTVTFARPVQLVSPAYIAQRNQVEMGLLKVIAELKEENARLRATR